MMVRQEEVRVSIRSAQRRGVFIAASLAAAQMCGCGSSGPQHIVDQSGSAAQTTAPFRTNASWQLVYSWDCASARARRTPGANQFGIQVFNADDDTLASDHPQASRTGTSGQGTLRYTRAGPYYVQVNTVCDWRLQVLS